MILTYGNKAKMTIFLSKMPVFDVNDMPVTP